MQCHHAWENDANYLAIVLLEKVDVKNPPQHVIDEVETMIERIIRTYKLKNIVITD